MDAEATTSNKEAGNAGPSFSQAVAAPPPNLDELLKDFYADVRDVDRDNEVNRILWAFKLNPYERMGLRFDSSMDDIKKQFRKVSLLVHPDKCKHPQASAAFEVLGEALKQLSDDEHRTFIDQVLSTAREEIRKERKKETKHDSLVRVASLLNEGGRASVEEQWEQTDE
jgi:DnaJ family protein C protein 8